MKTETQKYQRFLILFIFLHMPVYVIACYFFNSEYSHVTIQIILSAVAGAGFVISKKNPALGCDLVSMALALTPAVLVYVLEGHPWQIDAHMYFFAVLAMVVGFSSYRSVIAAAAAIAIHHLSLNFLLPQALFPTGIDLSRVIFHAVVVIIESGALLSIIKGLKSSEVSIKLESQRAKEASEYAEQAQKNQEVAAIQANKERAEALNDVASKFEQQIGLVVAHVQESASKLNDMASGLTTSIQRTTQQSDNVASASHEASNNVQTVAAATEQMAASIKEISHNVLDTAEMTKNCAIEAQSSQGKLETLQNAVGEIDSVIQAINDVAEQTNLLALNATIEAARAGEAGKGFAVVASEVKTLANETHKMTEEISKKVEDIKSSAIASIQSVESILKQISSVDHQTTSIAGAVEEQEVSTQEIFRSVQEAASGTNEVSNSIEHIRQAANDSANSTGLLKNASEELDQQAKELKEAMQSFLREVRT